MSLYDHDNYKLVDAVGEMSGYWLTSSGKEKLWKDIKQNKNWKTEVLDLLTRYNKVCKEKFDIQEKVKDLYFRN